MTYALGKSFPCGDREESAAGIVTVLVWSVARQFIQQNTTVHNYVLLAFHETQVSATKATLTRGILLIFWRVVDY